MQWPVALSLAALPLVACLFQSPAAAQEARGIVGVRALPDALVAGFSGFTGQGRILELRPYQTFSPDQEYPVAWEGTVDGGEVSIPRFAGARDRLYSKLLLVDTENGQPVGAPRYVDDFSALPVRDFDMPWPESIKGVTCPVGVDDLVALGVKYADTNVGISGLIDWRNPDPAVTWEVDGRKIGINMGYVRGFDEHIKQMNAAGINVTLILLNMVPTQPEPGNPLIHPKTDLANAPNHLGAFNLTDEEGLLHYRAAVEFLADRYSQP